MSRRVRYQVVNDGTVQRVKEIHRVTVHQFRVGDVDDPEIYAAQPLWEWQESDAGKFVMEHAIDKPEYHQRIDHTHYGYQYAITAELEVKHLAEFYLRFGNVRNN